MFPCLQGHGAVPLWAFSTVGKKCLAVSGVNNQRHFALRDSEDFGARLRPDRLTSPEMRQNGTLQSSTTPLPRQEPRPSSSSGAEASPSLSRTAVRGDALTPVVRPE